MDESKLKFIMAIILLTINMAAWSVTDEVSVFEWMLINILVLIYIK